MELLEHVHQREVPFDTEGIWNSFCFAGEPAGSQAGRRLHVHYVRAKNGPSELSARRSTLFFTLGQAMRVLALLEQPVQESSGGMESHPRFRAMADSWAVYTLDRFLHT